MTSLTIYTDGGARGNPGPAAIGVHAQTHEAQVAFELSEYIGETTNNWAEYEALIRGLTKGTTLQPSVINVRMDSELIVKQLSGEYRVKDPELKKQYEKVQDILRAFKGEVSFEHVPRAKNKEADRLVNEALDQQSA